MIKSLPMNNSIDSEKVLKYHGKTFYFAQRFLGRKNGYAVARLYRFCRFVDDLADESTDKDAAAKKLYAIRSQLSKNIPSDPYVKDFLNLAAEWQVNIKYALDLIDGVIMDLGTVDIQDHAELLGYCYRVAGTVGLMMCPLLHAEEKGEKFALDLGIAMQLTNIARDVLYDANQDRRYLPSDWVGGLTAAEILELRGVNSTPVQEAIHRVLNLAEEYYQSARNGYINLPMRSRISIAIAAKTYRQIGIKIIKNGCKFWHGRTYTTLVEKILLALREIAVTLSKAPFLRRVEHNKALHTEIMTLYPSVSNSE